MTPGPGDCAACESLYSGGGTIGREPRRNEVGVGTVGQPSLSRANVEARGVVESDGAP